MLSFGSITDLLHTDPLSKPDARDILFFSLRFTLPPSLGPPPVCTPEVVLKSPPVGEEKEVFSFYRIDQSNGHI